jgi:hypothetical protein
MRDTLQFLRELHTHNPSSELKNLLKTHRYSYKKAIKSAKKASNDRLILNSSNPTKTMWKIINNAIGVPKKKTSSFIPPVDFNDYFVNIALNLQWQVHQSVGDPTENIPTFSHDPFTFGHVTFVEMRDVINELKNNHCFSILHASTWRTLVST